MADSDKVDRWTRGLDGYTRAIFYWGYRLVVENCFNDD